MRKFIFIPVLLFFCTAAVQAQDKKYEVLDTVVSFDAPKEEITEYKTNDTLFIDTALYYDQLELSPDSVNEWKKQEAFSYVKNLDSLLKNRQKKTSQKEAEQEKDVSGPGWLSSLFSSGIFHFFLWSIAIIFVLFVLYNLFLTEGAFRKNTRSSKAAEPEAEEEVITRESDFEVMIRQAVQSGNYRLAIRYHYLQTLHKLADRNLITLAGDKTNYQYVREIANQNYQNDFAGLTLNYEYVWYGEFAIEEIIYRRLETGFAQFNSKI